ncbi:MAG: polysaccharide biosynthesis tyrosine autokinase [Thermoflexales bacterium]
MEVQRILKIAAAWWWLILASALVAAVTSFVVTRQSPPIYQSRAALLVGQTLRNPNASGSDTYSAEALAKSYADLAVREPVLQGALNALGLKWDWLTLKSIVNARAVPGTQVVEVTVIDTDPVRVKALASEIANQLIQQSPSANDSTQDAQRQFTRDQVDKLRANIKKAEQEVRELDDAISKSNSARQILDARTRQTTVQTQITTWQSSYAQLLSNIDNETPNALRVIEAAQQPTIPIGPNLPTNVLLATLIGLSLGAGAAVLLDFIDDTMKAGDDIGKELSSSFLGTIPRIGTLRDRDSAKLLGRSDEFSPGIEALQLVRTNLQFSAIDKPLKTLMVTSSRPSDGKSLTAANLAMTLARTGARVIIVDADLRRPTQHYLFNVPNYLGLTNALLEKDTELDKFLITYEGLENLRILPAGPLVPNPPELLASNRMRDIIAQLRERADIVIFDALPVINLADALSLGQQLDGALLVVRVNRTRRQVAQAAVANLRRSGIHIFGVVLNDLRVSRNNSYYYYADRKDGKSKRRGSRSGRSFGAGAPASSDPGAIPAGASDPA